MMEDREVPYDVEVIIPVYNVERFVQECIDSVLVQNTRFSYHVTIINDGSTDGSRSILKRYENVRHVTIIDQENKGFSGARNTGLEQMRGRYVTFVDSDDRLPENAIEALMSAAVEGDYDIVGGGYVRFEEDKRLHATIPGQGTLFGFPWGKVYKSHLWRNVRFPEKYWFEDTINAFVIHDMAKKSASIKDVVYEWRINRNSISFTSKGRPKILDTIYITDRLLEDRERLGLPVDKNFYDTLLHQFKINAVRVYSLGDGKMNYANYVISKAMYDKYYKGKGIQTVKYKEIESAMTNGNYRQFVLASLFL